MRSENGKRGIGGGGLRRCVSVDGRGAPVSGNLRNLVYDDLIDGKLIGLVPESCEKIYVGKRCGRHSMKQEEINRC